MLETKTTQKKTAIYKYCLRSTWSMKRKSCNITIYCKRESTRNCFVMYFLYILHTDQWCTLQMYRKLFDRISDYCYNRNIIYFCQYTWDIEQRYVHYHVSCIFYNLSLNYARFWQWYFYRFLRTFVKTNTSFLTLPSTHLRFEIYAIQW